MSATAISAGPLGFVGVASAVARSQSRASVGAVLLTLVATALALAQPLALRALVDRLGGAGPVLPVVGLLIGATLGEAAVRGLTTWWVQTTSEELTLDLRTGLVAHVLSLPLRTLEQTRRGDLVARLTADSSLVRHVLSAGLLEVAASALLVVGALVMMALIDLMLTAITLGAIAVAVLVVVPVAGRLRRLNSGYQERVGGLGVLFDSVLSSVRLLRAYTAEQEYVERLRAGAGGARDDGRRLARISALVEPVVAVVTQGAFLTVLVVGGARIAAGEIGVGDLVGFLLYLFMVLLPTAQMLNGVAKTQAGVAAWGRLHEILELAPEPSIARGCDPAPGPRGAPVLALDDVTFEHRPGAGVYGVTLEFPARSHTAIVGPSGAGKSTILALLQRFYEPEAGAVLLHGVPTVLLDAPAHRRQVHLVEQNSPTLATTIRDNLCIGGVEADDETLCAALGEVGLSGLVLRGGRAVLDGDIGDDGLRLSGGERQRLAWARLLLSDREVILLDEPTSNVDPETEARFTAIVENLARERTVVTVAHRLTTVRTADRVVVVDAGRVVGAGPHEDLLVSCPLYARLVAAAT